MSGADNNQGKRRLPEVNMSGSKLLTWTSQLEHLQGKRRKKACGTPLLYIHLRRKAAHHGTSASWMKFTRVRKIESDPNEVKKMNEAIS
jgi:hypothetical protein